MKTQSVGVTSTASGGSVGVPHSLTYRWQKPTQPMGGLVSPNTGSTLASAGNSASSCARDESGDPSKAKYAILKLSTKFCANPDMTLSPVSNERISNTFYFHA